TLNNCEAGYKMRAAIFVLLSWGDRLGFKTKLPLGPVPKPRPHQNSELLPRLNGYLSDPTVHEAWIKNQFTLIKERSMFARLQKGKTLPLAEKFTRLKTRLRDPEWRRYGKL